MRLLLAATVCLALLSPRQADAATEAGAGPSWVVEDDERRLWQRAEEEEKRLDTSPLIYRNPGLERYLEAVVRRLIPPERLAAQPVRFTVIKNGSLNAFMFPNGRAYLHSGMLAVMENEAQLATILAHESIHALNHHMVRELRGAKDKTALTAFLGALTGNILTPLGQLGALASVQGYSRDLETEADREGFRLLVQAGYDPAEAPKVFQALQREAREEGDKEPFFFASHPKLQARIDNLNGLLPGAQAGARPWVSGGETYLRTVAPLLLDCAEMDLKAGRFKRARECLARHLKGAGESARGYLLLGESYRRDGKNPDLAKARECYLKSAALDPGYAEPHRMLGLVAYKANERELARKSLGRYLELSPGAADRGYIEQMLRELK